MRFELRRGKSVKKKPTHVISELPENMREVHAGGVFSTRHPKRRQKRCSTSRLSMKRHDPWTTKFGHPHVAGPSAYRDLVSSQITDTTAGQQFYCAAGFSRSGIPAEGTAVDLADDQASLHCYGALFVADLG